MLRAPMAPRLHLFVCANRREPDAPLGPGCGGAGEATYAALKAEIARRGAYQAIWVTKTHCLGVCPARGCTVAIYPAPATADADAERATPGALFAEVEPADAVMLVAQMSASVT